MNEGKYTYSSKVKNNNNPCAIPRYVKECYVSIEFIKNKGKK